MDRIELNSGPRASTFGVVAPGVQALVDEVNAYIESLQSEVERLNGEMLVAEEQCNAELEWRRDAEAEVERLRHALDELTDPPTYSEANFEAMVDKARTALRKDLGL